MILLDGKATAQKIIAGLKPAANTSLNIILAGDNPASLQYVAMKQKKADSIGLKTRLRHFPSISSTSQITELIQKLNTDTSVTAIMVQLPLPSSLDTFSILNSISPAKDADGLTAVNLGLLFQNRPEAIASATPLGVINLLAAYQIDLAGKNAVIIGRSPYIGLPLAALFLRQNATVTICHSHTQNLKNLCLSADILVSAVGKQNFITADMVKEGSVVIDIGLSPDSSGKLVGDIDFAEVSPKCSYITPVPGGIGPMTIAGLLENTVNISLKSQK